MDLSILIPARNEMFLARTVRNLLDNIRGETEIIVVLDGAWAVPKVPEHERVTIIYHPESVGQRAATNDAARVARGRYLMKLDAHCSISEGFDVAMVGDMQDNWTMVPTMYNLHAFDWVCEECDHHRYQGPSGPCKECGGDTARDILWKAKPSPKSTAMRFDRELKFKYWGDYKKRQSGDLVDTLSCLGACWMLTRDRYFELNICDESHGSWGQQGTEVACKTWLSGGRLVCTKKAWFAHMFRTQGGDFGFPYPMPGKDVSKARAYSKAVWRAEDPDEMPRWDKAIYPLSWLIERFAPVPDWETIRNSGNSGNSELSKGIVYYTENRLAPTIMDAAQAQLESIGLPIVSVSLQSLNGFGQNIVVDGEPGVPTMFRQILAGLEAIDAEVVFFAEHDIIYHRSHFDFTPVSPDIFYYNQNSWKVDAETGKALFHHASSTSGLCAYRSLLLEHYRKRVEMVESTGFTRKMGFEPGTHGRAERVDDYKSEVWMSEHPNLDIRHGKNLTRTRWTKEEFRNKRFTEGWVVAGEVPWWGQTEGRMEEVFDGLPK